MNKNLKDAKIRVVKSGRIDHLTISLDYDYNPKKRYPVLLFIPDTKKHDHWHIKLGKKESRKLVNYLNGWLNE